MIKLYKLLKVLENTLAIAHDLRYVKWIWWYHVESDKLEAYTPKEVYGHNDLKFTAMKDKDETGWIKGRIFTHDKVTYLMVYANRYGRVSPQLLSKLFFRLKGATHMEFDSVIDDQGFNLLEKIGGQVHENLVK